MSLRNSDSRNVSPSFRLPLSLDTVLQVGMDGGSSSSRLESDRPSKSSRQSGSGKFQPLITELEMVIKAPLFFQSPGSVRDKAEGQPYGNVPITEDDKREWTFERFGYEALIDYDRASAVKLSGTGGVLNPYPQPSPSRKCGRNPNPTLLPAWR